MKWVSVNCLRPIIALGRCEVNPAFFGMATLGEGTGSMFSREFTPEELVSWLERRLSDMNFQVFKGVSIELAICP